jgi:threonine dehydrogenase-like Zn-dependent dehydrogenase
MRVIVGIDGKVHVRDIPDLPEPVGSQILVETVACGICGSDVHVMEHTDAYMTCARDSGSTAMMWDPARGVMLGHCFVFKVLATGPEAVGFDVGDLGTGIGTITSDGHTSVVGFSDTFPGGMGERMLLSTPGLITRLPDGMDPVHAVFVEPLLVGEMAVRTAGIADGAPAVVLGTGQVGLGIVAALRRHGRHPVIAAEPTALRREAAAAAGADIVVDATTRTWLDALAETGATRPPTVFDTTGVAGMLARLFAEVPRGSHIVEVSGQYEPDPIRTGLAVKKNLRLTFSCDADPAGLGTVLNALATKEVDTEPWITRRVGLHEVPKAFEDLRNPDNVIAIVVEPQRG